MNHSLDRRGRERIKVLVLATLYPNPAEPTFGIFVHRRIQHVAKWCDVKVVAPVPYFPLGTLLKRYAHRTRIPSSWQMDGIEVAYPRFLSVPRYLKSLDGLFLFLCAWWYARKIRKDFDFDLIDAHLAYPDGLAGYLLSRLVKRPYCITLRGHDINHTPQFPVRRRQIVAALRGANRVMSVATALRDEAVRLGCPPDRIETVPNGVETEFFHPQDRLEARRGLDLPENKRILLSVGHLVERKGQHIIIRALAALRAAGLDDLYYVMVGDASEEGNFRQELVELVGELGLSDCVLFAGRKENSELAPWYNSADLLCLGSSKEGRANVLLEALACGTPVVATNVWGTPEVIRSADYGVLVERDADSFAAGIRAALKKSWDRSAMVRYASSFGWADVATKVVRNYRAALQDPIAVPAGSGIELSLPRDSRARARSGR